MTFVSRFDWKQTKNMLLVIKVFKTLVSLFWSWYKSPEPHRGRCWSHFQWCKATKPLYLVALLISNTLCSSLSAKNVGRTGVHLPSSFSQSNVPSRDGWGSTRSMAAVRSSVKRWNSGVCGFRRVLWGRRRRDLLLHFFFLNLCGEEEWKWL